ncbi:MAG: hypothetical protein ACTHK2_15010 [Dokdonella sp.]|uniref:hypothetical protein n=1 Tax=Dokdonella sp. TaxID=2291710 RepID=UPI003F809B00
MHIIPLVRHGVLASALLGLAAGASIDRARAAESASAGTTFWVGCYRLNFEGDASKTRDVRLTDVEVPARPGSYAVESLPSPDADLASSWRPTGASSIRIGMSNGRTGWSAELKAADDAFVGPSNWVDDTGHSGAGYLVTAKSIPCDGAGAAKP